MRPVAHRKKVQVKQVQSLINASNLLDIAEGKPAVQNTWIPYPGELPPFVSSDSIRSTSNCRRLRPLTSADQGVLFVDLLRSYPIISIHLIGSSEKSQFIAKVEVFIDDKFCAMVRYPFGDLFQCTTQIYGRVLTLKTKKKIYVCDVKVYTCAPGLTGGHCLDSCEDRTYGPSCVFSCNCWDRNETCNIMNGDCDSGCRFGAFKKCSAHYKTSSKSYFKEMSSKISSVQSLPSGNISKPKNAISQKDKTKFHISQLKDKPKIHISQKNKPKNQTGQKDKQCEDWPLLKSSKYRDEVFISIPHNRSFFLYGVKIDVSVFKVSPPFTIIVTGDGVPCYGTHLQEPLPLGIHTFRCQRPNIMARNITITIQSFTTELPATLYFKVCKIQAITCGFGYYGPECSIACNCEAGGYSCHAMTGFCPSKRCEATHAGRNCGSTNIAATETERTEFYRDTSQAYRYSKINTYPDSYFDNKTGMWVSWWALQLNKVYSISWMTIHVKKENIHLLRYFAVYTDMDARLFWGTDTSKKPHWKGLGCARYRKFSDTIEMTCPGPMRTITVVSYSSTGVVSTAVDKLEAWVCADGTFGEHCERLCHCNNRSEICDKSTGSCASGCADGYAGPGCQILCRVGSILDGCWRKCNCLRGLGCGPGKIICTHGCEPGWRGASCTETCPFNFYGSGCKRRCSPGCKSVIGTDCDPRSGICTFGCSDLSGFPPLCETPFITKELMHGAIRQNLLNPSCNTSSSDCEAVTSQNQQRQKNRIIRAAIVIVASSIAAIILFFLTCTVFKLCWTKITDPKGLEQKRADLQMRKMLSKDVNLQIMREHADYHEHYLHQGILNRAVAGRKDNGSSRAKMLRGNELLRKTILQLQKNDKLKRAKPQPIQEGRCTPLKDNTQQDADYKVAKWILKEDFDELINRRKQRLKEYSGDVLKMQESTYAISSVSLGTTEIHTLYDEVGALAIP